MKDIITPQTKTKLVVDQLNIERYLVVSGQYKNVVRIRIDSDTFAEILRKFSPSYKVVGYEVIYDLN